MRRPGRVGTGLLAATVLALGAAACSGAPAPRATSSATTTAATPSSPSPSHATSPAPPPSTAGSQPTTPSARPTTVPPSPTRTTGPPTRPTTPPPASPHPTSSAGIPAALRGTVVPRVPTSQKVVALTFDAGANGDGVPSILATLKAQRVPASFFLTGDFVRAYPGLARQLAAYGRVGNHTDSHPHMIALTATAEQAEVIAGADTITTQTGQDPRPLFRFPFGESTGRDVALVNALGYVAVGWTVDSLGWKGTSGGVTVDAVVSRVVGARTPGGIVLMHVGSNPDDHTTLDAAALPRIISGLRSYGYGFVSLSALGT